MSSIALADGMKPLTRIAYALTAILSIVMGSLLFGGLESSAPPAVALGASSQSNETRWVLFRTARKELPVAEVAQPKIAVSSIKATVTGIVSDGENPVALIVFPRKGAEVYRLGMELKDGWRIAAINRDSVVVENQGALEQLPLKSFVGEGQLLIEEAPKGSAQTASPESIGLAVARVDSGESAVALAEVDETLLNELGLLPSDFVLSVGEIAAVDIFNKPENYTELLARSEWVVKIEREGRNEELSIPLSSMLRVVSRLNN